MYKKTWIVVANGSKARFFRAHNNDQLLEVETLIHPRSRCKGEEIYTDRPGRSFDRIGPGRHSMGDLDEPQEEELKTFAREVVEKLNEIHQEHDVDQLFIAASPQFLGLLSKKINGGLAQRLQGKIDKDLTALGPEEIRTYLPLVL